MLIDDLPTPCLLVERARLEENLTAMQARADANGVRLRPHVKTHKSVALARRQAALGAQGVTVATVREAEVFVAGGLADVRIAYALVGEERLRRVAALLDEARVSFCVDTPEGARAASAFFAAEGREAEVLVEVDTGHGRCGVPWDGPEGVALVRLVAGLPGLRLVGLLTHAGQAYHGPEAGETAEAALRRAGAEERDRMLALAARLHAAGLAAPGDLEISVGSTPSMAYFENRTAGGFAVTEIRPGNYVFYDAMQVGLGVVPLTRCALTALSTVVSKRRDAGGQERLYLDAGKKVLTTDTSPYTDGHGVLLYNPVTMQPLPHARLTGLSEEHGWVQVPGGATLQVGDRVRIVPNHACVSVFTQPRLYVVEDDAVVDVLTVDAR